MKRFLLTFFCSLGIMAISLAEEVVFDFTNPKELVPTVSPNQDGEQETHIANITFVSNGVSLTMTDGNTPTRIWTKSDSTYELRMYKGASVTITVMDGKSITDIQIEGNATKGFTETSIGNVIDGVWSGKANSVVLTVASSASTQKISSITITVTPTHSEEEEEEESTTVHYDIVAGKKGKAVKTALMEVIDEHTQRSYADLWTDFYTTDCRPDGKVWDMYSNATSYIFGENQSKGGDSGEGSSYNREHSFPKSWFGGEKYPMYTDLFHLYPTDSYINQIRSNYPFGEVATVKKESKGGHSKLGTSAVSGYSGTVFEPADEYKGDFARTYFYMATRYENQIAGWTSDMLSGDAYPAFADWAITMLLKWHREDPVSEKEINRNEAVYAIQGNRNPYIDYPVFAELIWGELTDVSVNITKLILHSNNYDTTDTAIETEEAIQRAQRRTAAYDLTGRLIPNPVQGIYIVNGKKVTLK